MLTPDPPRRRLRGLAAATLMTVGLLVPAGAVLATDSVSADLDSTTQEAVPAQLGVDELESLVEELGVANDDLRAETVTLQRSIDELTVERDRLQSSLDHFTDLYAPIDADRRLLFELRKGLPDTRPEAEAQLQRIRDLALASNPAQLGQLVDRVEAAAPAFLDWRFTPFTSTQEATDAYVSSGANAFDSTMNEFRNEVLLSVANRLDGLLTVLDRLR
jgi:hypothetical protein